MDFINGFLTWNNVISVLVGALLATLLLRRRNAQVAELETLRATSTDSAKSEETLRRYRESPEFKAVLDAEFLRGKAEGASAEIGNFTIQMTPFTRRTGGIVNHVGEIGYQMQLYYRNLPIGDVTERVVDTERKVKTDEIWKLVAAAVKIVEEIASTNRKNGIPIQVMDGKER